MDTDVRARLEAWFAQELPGSGEVRVEGLERIEFGHSAEMLTLTLVWTQDGRERRRDVVLRLRPAPPGLLEPYDLRRQFDILRALEPTPVRAPRALWIESEGDVLGRPFYVMERLEGRAYERELPPELATAPDRVVRMSEEILEQVAAIHRVDLAATGLDTLGDGRGHLDQELDRWAADMHRWQRDTLPAMERLLAALREQQPAPCPVVTLVHGDPKPGNFAFAGDELTGVFDWELAGVGDPLTDIGWMDINWKITGAFRGLPASHFDELVDRYQALTGIKVEHRSWYRAFQTFKMAVIVLVGSMLFDHGFSDDMRHADNAGAISFLTRMALADLGITEETPSGPVRPRAERIEAVNRGAGHPSAAPGR